LSESHWTRIAERGSVGALRFGAWFHRRFGRKPTLVTTWIASLYFFVASASTRRGSRQYLERLWASPEGRAALGKKPGAFAVLRHIQSFAVSFYDRFIVWGGGLDQYEIEHDGSGRIFELAREGRGALLLGAHLGNSELLWFLSKRYDLAINVVVYYENAPRVNAFFDAIAPGVRVRAIGLDPSSVNAAFQIKACIDRGEFVVMLADRPAPGEHTRNRETTFLGAPARFPLGPFALAGVLGCPVFMALCVRIGDSHYESTLRPLRDGGAIPRREREKRAFELQDSFVAALESYCLRLPFEWFNFFEYWDESSVSEVQGGPK
jgi:predicted LPLAT superfamily acyltransferase